MFRKTGDFSMRKFGAYGSFIVFWVVSAISVIESVIAGNGFPNNVLSIYAGVFAFYFLKNSLGNLKVSSEK